MFVTEKEERVKKASNRHDIKRDFHTKMRVSKKIKIR